MITENDRRSAFAAIEILSDLVIVCGHNVSRLDLEGGSSNSRHGREVLEVAQCESEYGRNGANAGGC